MFSGSECWCISLVIVYISCIFPGVAVLVMVVLSFTGFVSFLVTGLE